MIKTTPVQLPSCPDALQTAVRERLGSSRTVSCALSR